ncbi:MAG: DUF1189 domain-containing protein [Candidatus Omnitrophica bacterium]|nr:DUF1189 domain-containing protein [Candidatus Omnitrophota bacterium]
MNGLLTPVFTLFSRPFYRSVSRDPSRKGFLYLLYLGALFTLVVLGMMVYVVMPKLNSSVEWIKREMPTLVVAKDGLSMNQPSPYTMIHPTFGPVVTFDMTKDTITLQEMGKISAFVTETHFYLNENGQLKEYSVKEMSAQNKNLGNKPVTVNAQLVEQFYKTMKPTFFITIIIGGFVFFYLWKILTALLYSMPATAFNSMRSEKLSYGKLLDLTVYALTPATLFQILRTVIPVLNKIPFLFVLDISITLAYLYFAVKMSESEPAGRPSAGFSN